MAPWSIAQIPLRFEPPDVTLVAAPLAVLLAVGELVRYWRFGRRPARSAHRAVAAGALAAVLLPGLVLLAWWWAPSTLMVIAALLVPWVFRSYRRTTSPISRPVKALCVALRLLAILLLAAYLLRPAWRRCEVFYDKAVLLVLYDMSRSMTIDDAGGDGRTSRIDAVRSAVRQAAGRLDAVRDFFDVRQFSFDESLGPQVQAPADLDRSPRGQATAIGRAIQRGYLEAAGQKVAAVILVTDGASNADTEEADPLAVAGQLARLNPPVPVWAVGVGRQADPTRPDVIAKSMTLPARKVAAFNVLPVRAVFELVKLAGHPVTVELLLGRGPQAEVVDRKVLVPAADHETVAADLAVMPKATGFQTLTVRLAPTERLDGRPLASEHSELSEDIQVVDELIHVLYVEGKFRVEARELAAALAGANLLRVDRQFVLNAPALTGAQSPQLPAREADWLRYHVVILGDVRADAFTAEQLRIVRRMVRDDGKGLMMIGGMDSFGQGGWPDSPLADAFPIDLRQAAGQATDRFRIVPTERGLSEQLMRLDDEPADNAALWAALPPMQGANSFPDADSIARTRPGAAVLAASDAGRPVIVAAQIGAGRSLAVAFDTTWRWRLHLDRGRQLHNRFWRQAVLWLANRKSNVWVTTRQMRYRLSQVTGFDAQSIIATAGLEDQTGAQVHDPNATLTLFAPPDQDGRPEGRSIPLDYRTDHYQAALPPPTRDGTYKLLFRAALDNKPVQAEAEFLVESPDIELDRRLADLERLKRMAALAEPPGQKGGPGSHYFPIDRFDELLARFNSSDYLVRREEWRSTPFAEMGPKLRDMPLVRPLIQSFWPALGELPLALAGLALLIVASLTAEWVIRKRRSLV